VSEYFVRVPCEVGHNMFWSPGNCPICKLENAAKLNEDVVRQAAQLGAMYFSTYEQMPKPENLDAIVKNAKRQVVGLALDSPLVLEAAYKAVQDAHRRGK
jgi:hypothetical protein